ncbi:MAG TPA: hypothetical protein VL404_01585 [Candidatus Eisenbacteria bacterium]|jgi:ElaB/YqjD/DUF883 family membrane-anchored ribosome-binding protein|nr:hypothetical protein [Candidatus Eisenbacteria bacterium]
MSTFNSTKRNGTQVLHEAQEKYNELKDAIQDAATQSKRTINHLVRATEEAVYEGSEKVKDAAVTVNRTVHKNPWPVIGGTALGALFVGFLIGKCGGGSKDTWSK